MLNFAQHCTCKILKQEVDIHNIEWIISVAIRLNWNSVGSDCLHRNISKLRSFRTWQDSNGNKFVRSNWSEEISTRSILFALQIILQGVIDGHFLTRPFILCNHSKISKYLECSFNVDENGPCIIELFSLSLPHFFEAPLDAFYCCNQGLIVINLLWTTLKDPLLFLVFQLSG